MPDPARRVSSTSRSSVAVEGDFLDKPLSAGGLALNRYSASATLTLIIVACILLFPQRALKKIRH